MAHLTTLITIFGHTPARAARCYALGYGTGVAAFVGMARRRGLATPGIMALLGAGLIGGLVGANLAQWVVGGTAGKTVLGALAGGYGSVAVYKRSLGIVRPTGDLFAVALCAGEAVGVVYFGVQFVHLMRRREGVAAGIRRAVSELS